MKRKLTLALCLLATAMAILSSRPALGEISITLNWEDCKTEYPDFDSDCSGLTALFEEAADRYRDIITEYHPLTINYWYEDLGPGDIVGVCNAIDTDGPPERVSECNIRIDTRFGLGGDYRTDWFIDESPELDNEFTMEHILYRDLDPASQASFFNGSTPDVFEVGYIGHAKIPDAMAGRDMLSVVMHEIGHALGMNGLAGTETADGDYDINPDLVGGAVMAVNCAAADNRAHLAGSVVLLSDSLGMATKL